MSEIIFMIKCKKCKSVFNQGERTAVKLCEKCRQNNKTGKNYVRKNRVMKKEMKVTTGRCRFCDEEFKIKNFTAYSSNRCKQYCSQTCRTKFYLLPKQIMATKLQIKKLQKRLDVLTGIKNKSIVVNPNQ